MEKMTRLERAKQFMPFSALHGYDQVVREKERIIVEKHELTPEEEKELNDIILCLKKGDMISIEHYVIDRYVKTDGIITAIDLALKTIRVVKTDIAFIDIREIRKI